MRRQRSLPISGKIELHDNQPSGLVVTIDLPNGPEVRPL